MRLIELEIHNVRGILHLTLKPNGRNFLVSGPNGSGKSAVVDAIDFLLTGRISRLLGKGTGGITLNKYGPHIDHEPQDAVVRAIVQLPKLESSVEMKRCMAHPETLDCDDSVRQYLEPIMTLAERGQHVLTRRDILRYITSEAGTRAQEIQQLLGITEIEEIRKTLVKVRHKLERDLEDAQNAVDTAKGTVSATVQEESYREDSVMQLVNKSRTALKGQPISLLHSRKLKIGITPPTVVSSGQAVNVTLLEKDIENLCNVTLAENRGKIAKGDEQLRNLITTIRSDPHVLRELSRLELTKLGMTLIDDTGACPLCDTPWPPGKLCEYLKQRLSTAQVAVQYRERVMKLSDAIAGSVNSTIASLEKVFETAEMLGLKEEFSLLKSWLSDLQAFSRALTAPIKKYPGPRFGLEQVQRMLAPKNVIEPLERIHSVARGKYPETTPEQNAWDTLTRLEENFKALENAETKFKEVKLSQEKANLLLGSFQRARYDVLGKLYDDVRDRFVDLYRYLHKLDESKFTANIELEKAGLNFEVDFYGRGTHLPHALHSEGHQDSMGLCLYLTLAERLTGGLIDLVILDDVVMSIDTDHRRQLCHLLSTSFPNRQFLITTHDKTWANQLKHEGIVDSRGTVEFYNWHIETGPEVDYQVDMWERIEEDLQRDDLSSAALRLRRGSEQFFGMVCDALQAQVVYKLGGQWELGDFLPAAMYKYRKLLNQATSAAKSWGDKDCFDMLQELSSTVKQIYTRSNAEQWTMNANVHYNNWSNFSKNDFRPVLEAFQDLYSLFICSSCGGMLRLAIIGMKPVAVRCSCGKVNWNLKGKTN